MGAIAAMGRSNRRKFMGFMSGKRALIVGVASDRSIAAGIAEAFAREGAEIAFTYQNDKLKSRVEKLATRLGQNTDLLFPATFPAMQKSTLSLQDSASPGTVWMYSSTQLVLHRASNLLAASSSQLRERALPSHTTSRPTALRR